VRGQGVEAGRAVVVDAVAPVGIDPPGFHLVAHGIARLPPAVDSRAIDEGSGSTPASAGVDPARQPGGIGRERDRRTSGYAGAASGSAPI
jgi:hypothetical protein